MAHARWSRSRRGRKSAADARRGVPAKKALPAFADPFPAAWIGERLGDTENRRLLILYAAGGAVAATDDCPAATIAAHGGHVIQRPDGTLLGAWGVHAVTQQDPARITAAAQALREAAQARPILDVQSARVPKAGSPDAAIVAAAANLLSGSGTVPAQRQKIVLSEAFRLTCLPGINVRPVKPVIRGVAAFHTLAKDDALAAVACDGPGDRLARIDGLGDLKAVMVAAAIAGTVFTLEVLAWMLEMEAARLLPALEAACATGLLHSERGPGGHERFIFRDADLQATAYALVPPGDRLRLHRRIAQALRQSESAAAASPPELVAHHHRIADDPHQSRRWLGKAAWQAIAAGEAEQAVQHLRQALYQAGAAERPRGLDRALQQLLGVQLAVTCGNGSDAVRDACRDANPASPWPARRLPAQAMRTLWLAQSCHLVKGEIGVARTIGRRLLSQLTHPPQRTKLTLGAPLLVHRMYALALMLSGRLQHAAKHYERVIGDYDAARHGILRFAWGSDQAALAHAHYAWTQALAGNASAVTPAIRRARAACERFNHAHTTAHTLSVAAIAAFTADAMDEAAFAAREARAVAVEHRFPYWTAWNDIMLSAIDAESLPRTAYRRLDQAHRGYRETGAAQLSPVVCALRSAAALNCRRPVDGLEQADAGLALTHPDGCSVYRPELLRHRARALFALGNRADADKTLETAYCEAVRSGTKCFARRIACDGLGHSTGPRYRAWQTRFQVTN